MAGRRHSDSLHYQETSCCAATGDSLFKIIFEIPKMLEILCDGILRAFWDVRELIVEIHRVLYHLRIHFPIFIFDLAV